MRSTLAAVRKTLALLALGAGAVGAVASTPLSDGWAADPEEQFLLDVNIRQLRLGDGVRAYNTPQGTCILFGDFLTAIDVPMKIDLAGRRASGWAFREANRIAIDLASGAASYGGKSEKIGPTVIRETPEGWCVDSKALARWFGIGVNPLTSGSALLLESEAKLPAELAIERQKRAASLTPAKFDVAELPQVRLPYRLWRAPALDFVVSAGATYRADTGARVDRTASIRAAGEIARLSYDAFVATNQKGMPTAARFRAYRSDPDGELLGPLKATHVAFGDVTGFDSRLAGAAGSGRGAVVTNRPLHNPTSFDRTRFEGDLPTGWEAEIYRNGELLAFTRSDSAQRYVFDDVQLLYGENRISIVLYGPQGQMRSREETINVGKEHVPPGETWYWAGFNQPGRDLIGLRSVPEVIKQPTLQAATSLEHGLDARTSVGVLARMMLLDDERVTFVEGSVRRSVGPAMVELAVARENGGGTAVRAQVLAKLGSVNVSAEGVVANDFHLQGVSERSIKDVRVALDAPLRLGRTVVPAHGDVRYVSRPDGSGQLEAAARLSANIERFNLATDIRYRKQFLAKGPGPPDSLELSFLGAGRIGDVRVRGSVSTEVAPRARMRSAEIAAYWSASENADWEGALGYDSAGSRARVRISHIRRFNGLALALTGEAASDGSLAFGINANFSLDPSHGLTFSRRPLAAAGAVRARVYRDLNHNGRREASGPAEAGALVLAGTRPAEKPTDANGAVLIGGLTTFAPLTVGIDASSLADPMLVPSKPLQVVVPRPGVPAEVEIGLVGGGDIEGAIVKNGGIGVEGLDLELIDSDGKVAATARTDFDGFFLFERVRYGSYSLRISGSIAATLNLAQRLKSDIQVSDEKPVARLGAIPVTALPEVASAQ